MPLVKYVANTSTFDGTGAIKLADLEGVVRVLTLGGDPLEVTDEELARIRSRWVIEVLDEEVPDEEVTEEKVENIDPPVKAFDVRSQITPDPSTPVAALSDPASSTTVSVGSTPSPDPLDSTNSPTPPAGH